VAGWRALWLRQGPIVVLWGGSRGDAGYCDMHVHCWGQGTPSNVRPPLPQFAAAVDGPFEGGGMFTVVGGVRIFNLGSSFTFSVGRGRLRMFSAVDFQTKMTPWQARPCIGVYCCLGGLFRGVPPVRMRWVEWGRMRMFVAGRSLLFRGPRKVCRLFTVV
jgi:hypothetical protein